MTAFSFSDEGTPRILPGDPAPGFSQKSPENPRYVFDSAAGRYLVLCFFGTSEDEHSRAAIEAVLQRADIFDDNRACFFGVTNDAEDETGRRVVNKVPGFRYFFDADLTVAKLYGIVPTEAEEHGGPFKLMRQWVVIDPTMRVIASVPFRQDRSDIGIVLKVLERLPPPERFAGVELQAPILFLPRVLEPGLCRHLISLYENDGGRESGFMREIDGRTVGVTDHSFKRRRDYDIADRELVNQLQMRFRRRVLPEIQKVHQFQVTRMERYIVSCYSAEDGGHFSAHRDNTTKGTAHRRFAVSINLNDDFDGGEVNFPEYGPRSFKAPAGGAVVFSCSLLHKVSRVTRGRRFAFLPFLYDDAAARIREQNAGFVGDKGSGYRAATPQPADSQS